MMDMIGKTVECHDMPDGSFYNAVRGELVDIRNGWASIRATRVIDRWTSFSKTILQAA